MDMKGLWKITHMLYIGDDGKTKWETMEEFQKRNAEDPDAALFASMTLVFGEDGSVLQTVPLPEDLTEDEIREMVDSGEIELYGEDRAVLEKRRWKEEGGKALYDTGVEGTVGETAVSPWIEILPLEGGGVEIQSMRLCRVEN